MHPPLPPSQPRPPPRKGAVWADAATGACSHRSEALLLGPRSRCPAHPSPQGGKPWRPLSVRSVVGEHEELGVLSEQRRRSGVVGRPLVQPDVVEPVGHVVAATDVEERRGRTDGRGRRECQAGTEVLRDVPPVLEVAVEHDGRRDSAECAPVDVVVRPFPNPHGRSERLAPCPRRQDRRKVVGGAVGVGRRRARREHERAPRLGSDRLPRRHLPQLVRQPSLQLHGEHLL